MAALEIAIDEMAEKLAMDPIAFRIANDTQVVPDNPAKPASSDPQSQASNDKHEPHPPFSQRQLVQCLRLGAMRFGWDQRNPQPGRTRSGRWLVGMGMASAVRDNLLMNSGARVRLDGRGFVTVETDMTDIGTGSYRDCADGGGDDGRPAGFRSPSGWATQPFRCPAARGANGVATARLPAFTRPV